jgi:hypothetical protein
MIHFGIALGLMNFEVPEILRYFAVLPMLFPGFAGPVHG